MHEAFTAAGAAALRRALDSGADPNERDFFGAPLICTVAAVGDLESLQLLLEYGAHPDDCGPDMWTPLIHACNAGHLQVAAFLVRRGANVSAKTQEGYTAADRIPKTMLTAFEEVFRGAG